MNRFRNFAFKYIRIMCCITAALSTFAIGFAIAFGGETTDDSTAVLNTVEAYEGDFFIDVNENDWFYSYVDHLYKDEVIKGKSKTEFCPYDNLSAAELCTLIARYHRLDSLAEERRAELMSLGVMGADRWYSGYIDLMLDGEIVVEGEFGISSINGNVVIGDSCAELLDSPITRQQAAELIARSFEMDGTVLTSKAMNQDTAKYGHNFIVGGGYSMDVLERYVGDIKDYDKIGDKYKMSVKKCYYNGIFSGDENSNFNPSANLTRAEAAKIIACTMDMQLRIRKEYRDIDQSFVFIDGALDTASKERLLMNAAQRTSTKDGRLYIVLENEAPFGYYIEVLISRELYGRCYNAYRHGLMTAFADYPTYPVNIDVKMSYNSDPCPIRAMFILRNMATGGDIEATYEVLYAAGGNVSLVSDVK